MRMSINTPEDSTVNEEFVQLVRDIPILWNMRLPQYRSRELKERKWAEVGARFNLSGSDAYKKFVALREKYKREQKLAESKKLSNVECWRLYEKLKFLDSVSISRDRRWRAPKMSFKRQHVFPMTTLYKHEFPSFIKTEFPDDASVSASTSPAQQMSEGPSEIESNEAYQDNPDFFNDAATHVPNSEDADSVYCRMGENADNEFEVHQQPQEVETNPSSSRIDQFLIRLETKTDAILNDYNRRNASWARCETLGHRVAQTMYALEENDPDLALKFDIILSEAIASIKKDQLERLTNRQKQ
ncbi:uncharacterized protein LOC129731854 [Wyeomyia smithii]|uniref:uncharacterized protein LOC129731854 n=1 Tax=Wyeomyia smithii TaxID=174621 RepID=UPI002467FF09|nr:uncharacterized protein LOC129731854 [Wyeomyia smithii]